MCNATRCIFIHFIFRYGTPYGMFFQSIILRNVLYCVLLLFHIFFQATLHTWWRFCFVHARRLLSKRMTGIWVTHAYFYINVHHRSLICSCTLLMRSRMYALILNQKIIQFRNDQMYFYAFNCKSIKQKNWNKKVHVFKNLL